MLVPDPLCLNLVSMEIILCWSGQGCKPSCTSSDHHTQIHHHRRRGQRRHHSKFLVSIRPKLLCRAGSVACAQGPRHSHPMESTIYHPDPSLSRCHVSGFGLAAKSPKPAAQNPTVMCSLWFRYLCALEKAHLQMVQHDRAQHMSAEQTPECCQA